MSKNLQNFPQELNRIIDVMKDTVNCAIVVLLDGSDIAESQLPSLLNIDVDKTREHTHQLELAGIIQNYLHKNPNVDEVSFFTLTRWGKEYLQLKNSQK